MGAFDDLIPGNEPLAVAGGGNAFGDLVPDEQHGRFFLNLREGWRSSLPGIVQSHVQAGRNLEELATEMDLGIQGARKLGRPDIPEWGELGGPPAGTISRFNPFAGHSVADAERMRDELRAEAARKLTEYQAKRGGEIREYAESPTFTEEPTFMGQLRGFFEAAGGQLLGGLPDPINLLPVGRGSTAIRSFGKGFVAGAPPVAAVDIAAQEQERNLGLREEFDPLRTAIGTLAGGATVGGLTATPQAAQLVRRLFGQPEARAIAPEQALSSDFLDRIITPEERPLADIIAERVGMERQRGTDADVGARVKQRRADVGEAFRAAETEGGIMRREDFGEEQPRPATDATGTVYTDPAALAAARRTRPRGELEEIEPGVRYAYERAGVDPDSIALAFERARMQAEPEPGRQPPQPVVQEPPALMRPGGVERPAVRLEPPEAAPAPREPVAAVTPEQLLEIERQRRLQPPEPPQAEPARPGRTQPIEAAQAPVKQPTEVVDASRLRQDAGEVQARGLERQGGQGEGRPDLEPRPSEQPGRPPQQPGGRVRQGPQAPPEPRLSVPERVEPGLAGAPREAAIPPQRQEGRTEPAAAPEAERPSGLGEPERARLAKAEVDVRVREAETGRTVKVKMRADEALADVDARLDKLRALWECLNA